ncbi:SMP-30/gluconolactonase/LRE family protein [Halovenus sp. WSH3]|uniref:SMP-30/gluconolactonase/LRE family protein n=1 Tax=Halovenus carboxidivorans TaxID=2692199 RepID=A0A6B0T8K8_9EURY|nr:SMP-30/gluconolactonase/LRE family protein [Halovenus carboxidivorans]MXR51190.1 SMP-30/gluconolactonase/LRE family protein [Halovenus carboxidivorans]
MSVSAILGTVAVALSRVDSRTDPREWHPPDPPELTGALAQNWKLGAAETVVRCDGPEDVAFDDRGRLYTGVEDGAVLRTVDPVEDGREMQLETFAETDGRPLGMEFDGEDLFVCAEDAGLLSISPDGTVRTLTEEAGGREIAFADDLYVAPDETIYFTDATVHDIFQDELLELQDTGRLLAYDPETAETRVVLSDLGFANGICPHPDGESVLVTETSRARVTRYYYDGDREGESELFADNLPGYPDNIEAGADDTFWLAVPTRRQEALEALHAHPLVKRQLGKLPESVIEAAPLEPYGLVLQLDADGEILDSLHDPDADVFGITSATPRDGSLYLGSLFGERVVRYDLD